MLYVGTGMLLLAVVSGAEWIPCRWDGDGGWDCAGRGLVQIPTGLSAFTHYLDLSMNNITELPANIFRNLTYLEELRLAGNDLTFVHPDALAGLHQLKVLMLQNNQLKTVPSLALKHLSSLQSLRLDANQITHVPEDSFEGLQQLRHLWLDDNGLAEIPVQPLGSLGNLQALTLALNRIVRIPSHAFANLSSLVVLHLHNNKIQEVGQNSFAGLDNLETLDLNFNNLPAFPEAIKALPKLKELGFHSNNIATIPEGAFHGNPLLRTVHLYDNPLSFVAGSAFQNLSDLHSLVLRGASRMTVFPNLAGTVNLESLTLTGTKISSIPAELCEDLKLLRTLDLSYNQIASLPSLQGCFSLEEINLQHNHIQLIHRDAFQGLAALHILDLSRNAIGFIEEDAFSSLTSLQSLDLSLNSLSSIPTAGLTALNQLKLSGNTNMKVTLAAGSLPQLRMISVPYAYQCCVFEACESAVLEDKTTNGDGVAERIQLPVHCSPAPGAFKPCEHLLGSWMIRLTVWFICVAALTFNSLVLACCFLPAGGTLHGAKLLVGLQAACNLLTGGYVGALSVLDAATWGAFGEIGALWETGGGCRALGFLGVWAWEASVLLLALAAVERSEAVRRGKAAGWWVRGVAAGLVVLAGIVAACPQLFGELDSPLCLPFSTHGMAALGFTVSLVLLNSLAYLLMALVYTRLYCGIGGARLPESGQGDWVRHVAWLIFTNCLFFCPVAAFSFTPLLTGSPEIAKSVTLIFFPLPACLNPVLYVFFSPHFREDWHRLREPRPLFRGPPPTVSPGPYRPCPCCSLKAHSCPALPAETDGYRSGRVTPSARSECADEGDSFVSDSSEQVQACGPACFYHSRGLPLVPYPYDIPYDKE